jgi:hypothetical protein
MLYASQRGQTVPVGELGKYLICEKPMSLIAQDYGLMQNPATDIKPNYVLTSKIFTTWHKLRRTALFDVVSQVPRV